MATPTIEQRKRGERGRDKAPRRLRLPPVIQAEYERTLVQLVNDAARITAKLEHKPLRPVVCEIAPVIEALSDHVIKCLSELGL